jgi:predicted DNA-binding transcriptional regulator YafY
MDALSRHEQLLRVFHLIDILFAARQPLTAAELKDRLRDRGVIDEMSEKNICRDVEFLGRFGYAVKESRKRTDRGTERKAWSIEPGRGVHELAAPAVSLPELLSLAAAREFLAPLAGTFYWRGIGQLLGKLERVATPELLAYAEAHKEGLVVHPKPATAKYGARMLSAVNTAIRNAVELAIRYQGLADPRPKRIVIHPEALVLYEGSIYIAARRAAATAGRGPTRGCASTSSIGSSRHGSRAGGLPGGRSESRPCSPTASRCTGPRNRPAGTGCGSTPSGPAGHAKSRFIPGSGSDARPMAA